MNGGNLWKAMACVGAVVGAGFASGREIVVFFTRYGKHSWWLIGLSALVMTRLCALCMRCAAGKTETALFQGRASRIGTLLLLYITGGAMVSAAGQMIALLWINKQAYWIAAAGTLMLAWVAGLGNTGIFGWFGSSLSALLLGVLVTVKMYLPPNGAAVQLQPVKIAGLSAAIQAAGYAAMNMALAAGVVCRCASKQRAQMMPWLFGVVIAGLMCMSNALYLQHPELLDEPFPIVRLLSAFGRKGFLMSIVLLYLAIFTTLVSIVCTIRVALEGVVANRRFTLGIVLLPMLCLSAAGFSGIVEKLYAPAGLLCLLLIFVPLFTNRSQERLDKLTVIQ